MVSGWDIPLRSLRNRRINVIEAAHENPFIPKPLVAISPRRLTIATMPFFHASTPIGVVVFFSPTPRGFADGLLKALSQSLRVCALALSELPATAAAAQRALFHFLDNVGRRHLESFFQAFVTTGFLRHLKRMAIFHANSL